ncbi:hypothetical protein KIN20_038240 [Parelaphostrongylus tenuis]|uniref:H15 domain-containing protein n=1 Tax=Parelaphostrongylus tenuis TaxID=148309 RepID=A0AAD5REV5_PARTN|nr:hypothetical protein KIN20_038240 [Parelaphostrongylus tenuis]
MSEVAAAPATAPTSQATKKTKQASKAKSEKKPRTSPRHPVYGAMIKSAIKELKDRRGVSKQAILKYIVQKYKVPDNEKQINARLRAALKRGLQSGLLTQATGSGAAGRFRLAEKSSHEAAPKAAKKPKVKRSKPKPKESAPAPANKEVKKEKSSSSPKKTVKPKAKSAKSPQKAAPKKKAAAKSKASKKTTKKAAPTKA